MEWSLPEFNKNGGVLKPFSSAVVVPPSVEQITAIAKNTGKTFDEVKLAMDDSMKWPIFKNDIYQVQIRSAVAFSDQWPEMLHLSIKRIDRNPIHDWRHLQAIKSMIVGPNNEAIEIYPSEDRVVDTANQYHLWVFADEKVVVPVGFNEGLRTYDNDPKSNTKQRPR